MTPTDATVETDPDRSALMKKVRQRDTEPELAVRRILTSLGARYRVNVSGLPGSPDLANRFRGKAIFVHGCFWHFHEGCRRGRIPKRNRDFWASKLHRNQERDLRKILELEQGGFDVMVVWECELEDVGRLTNRLESFWEK
jgi:DNA mismatch endonuclease (patch repair protein)